MAVYVVLIAFGKDRVGQVYCNLQWIHAGLDDSSPARNRMLH
jgi:hypothetical protein